MKLRTSFLIRVVMGFAIGMLVGVLMILFYNEGESIFEERMELIRQIIGSGLLGAVCVGGQVVYTIESWSIVKCTLIHYFLSMGALLLANHILGWYPETVPVLSIFILIMSAIYCCIWLVYYIIEKIEVKKLNEGLNLMQEKIKKEGIPS